MNKITLALLLALLGVVTVQAQMVKATVALISGKVVVTPNGSATVHILKPGEYLAIGSSVSTGPNSSVVIQAFPGVGINLNANSTLSVNKLAYKTSGSMVDQRAADLSLTQGSFVYAMDPITANANDVNVHAGTSTMTVHGGSGLVTTESILCSGGDLSIVAPQGVVNLAANQQYVRAQGVSAAAISSLQEATRGVETLVQCQVAPATVYMAMNPASVAQPVAVAQPAVATVTQVTTPEFAFPQDQFGKDQALKDDVTNGKVFDNTFSLAVTTYKDKKSKGKSGKGKGEDGFLLAEDSFLLAEDSFLLAEDTFLLDEFTQDYFLGSKFAEDSLPTYTGSSSTSFSTPSFSSVTPSTPTFFLPSQFGPHISAQYSYDNFNEFGHGMMGGGFGHGGFGQDELILFLLTQDIFLEELILLEFFHHGAGPGHGRSPNF